jgi:cysteine synthase A
MWAFAEALQRSLPGSWLVHQDTNPANVLAHYETTGPELWEATAGEIEVPVCGVGTGGTLTGLLADISSGAAAHAARLVACRERWAGATIVTVFPDTGERYLSKMAE